MQISTRQRPQIDLVALMRTHQAGVWRYLRYLGCDAFLADDLTQETFLAVLRHPFEDRGRSAAAAYLRFVARNLYLSSRRGAPSHLPYGSLEEADAIWARATPDEDSDRRVDTLRGCLEKLPERARRVVDLRYHEKKSSTQLAEALDSTADGVRSLLKRARQLLRECVEREMAREERK